MHESAPFEKSAAHAALESRLGDADWQPVTVPTFQSESRKHSGGPPPGLALGLACLCLAADAPARRTRTVDGNTRVSVPWFAGRPIPG